MTRAALRRIGLGAAIVAAAAGLTGCTGSTELPDGVTVLVYQPRTDVQNDRIAVQVANSSDEPLEITALRLESAGFADPAVWTDDSATVAAGFALDLRMDIPPRVCPDAAPLGTVTLDYRLGDTRGTAVATADDPYELLPRVADEACLRAEVEAVAAPTISGVLADGGAEGSLVVAVTPTGASGSVRLLEVWGTTLISPARDGLALDSLSLGIDLGADGPTEVRIPIVPTRCDAHALAEDKVGTRIPFTVAAGDRQGELVLAAGPEARTAIIDFWRTACGLG